VEVRDSEEDWQLQIEPGLPPGNSNMATNNPELQEKLQELEHELEVSCSVSSQAIRLSVSSLVACAVVLRQSSSFDIGLRS
jgi:hypothetical protein